MSNIGFHVNTCYLSSKKLFWFIFFANFTDLKLVLTHKNGKPSFRMLMIRSFS